MQKRPTDIVRYTLYGEQVREVAPEFLHIEDIPSRSALYDWVIAPHAHPGIFQLLMVTAGAAQVEIDGAMSTLAAPALICVPGHSVHAFAFAAGTQGWVLSVAHDLLGDMRLRPFGARMMEDVPQGRIIPLHDAPRAADRLDWLLTDMAGRMATEHGQVPDMVVSLLAAVLGVTMEAMGPLRGHPLSGDRRVDLVRAFEALVDAHFRDHLPISDYAALLAVASPTLTRACRAVLGKAPGEVLLDRLLLEAMRYLRHTAASAKQISGRLGFADPAYFARFFKARSGMTPRAFRQSLTQKAGSAPLDPGPLR
ncbi:MAG: helix-turn-helix domain-containing protein [Chakrabartia sp.]